MIGLRLIAVLAAFSGSTAIAACAETETTFLACTIAGGEKTLEVCSNDHFVSYRFGPTIGLPELELRTPILNIDYVPWPGVGRNIWEEVTFYNENASYVVHGRIERTYPENEADDIILNVAGGVSVFLNSKSAAVLDCDAGSVNFPWDTAIYDAKTAMGQCYHDVMRVWQDCPAD